MRRLGIAVAVLVAFGVLVAVAFGAEALWLYGFLALLVLATALAIGVGGDLITSWSRRRFDNIRPPER